MAEHATRREELIAAALADDLTPAETQELADASAADPSMVDDLAELRETVSRLGAARVTWREEEPSPDLADRIADAASFGAAGAAAAGAPPARAGTRSWSTRPQASTRTRWSTSLLLGAAAALLVVGGFGGQLVRSLLDAPPSGPPGTLGAVEQITFTEAPEGSAIEASLVAHTWGTETLLEVDGVAVGETFEVILVSASGQELTSGTFFGTEQTVTCRMNAALLREDLARVLIEGSDGAVLASSEVPTVEGR
ncbi:MAG: hypothetical protein M3520_10990 [Actinomycetota bacterium]|nr:hypothetical protein [Actinomycetota bacterium]